MKFVKCVFVRLVVVLLGPVFASEDERDGLIIYYFSLGYNYRLIVFFSSLSTEYVYR